MEKKAITLSELEADGFVPPKDFFPAPERLSEIAQIELNPVKLSSAVDEVMGRGLYSRADIEEAVAGLANGHLLIAGPPGTGKTELARSLAAAFRASIDEETANPEWSVFDTIGSQSLPGSNPPYRDGLVTRAILNCGNATVANLDTGKTPQARWLLIDEINRAEIDRAFGPLFTALSSERLGKYVLDYRHGAPVVTIPRRFRLVATMNSYDTRFVNTMSAGLRRRWTRVTILPPANEGTLSSAAEMKLALGRAQEILHNRFEIDLTEVTKILAANADRMRAIFGAIRSIEGQGGTPLGTAQVIDTLIFLGTLMLVAGVPSEEAEFVGLLDRALSARAMSSVESDATRLHLRDGYPTAFRALFPKLEKTNARLISFVTGGD